MAKSINKLFVGVHHMVVEVSSGREDLLALLAWIREGPWEVDVFDMLPQVAPVLANLSTDSASVSLRAILHYVLIQLLVSSCKQKAIRLVQIRDIY